jgi:ribosomal protein L37AE/L43A
MKIQTIESQHRRDFVAIYECEHCGHTHKASGYDDAYFHHKVIPVMECGKCGKTAGSSYRPLTTKYAEGQQV